MEKEKIKKEKIDAGEDLNNIKEISKKKLFNGISKDIGEARHDGESPLNDTEIAEVLQDRYDDLLYEQEKILEEGMKKCDLYTLINQHIAHERSRRNNPNEQKDMRWIVSGNELKTRGYGGLVYNITDMNDPSDIEEINDIHQLADTEYGESRLSECSDVYDRVKTATKQARISLHNEINTAIALHGEIEGLSHGEIIGILELVKLQYFTKTKDQIKEQRRQFLHNL